VAAFRIPCFAVVCALALSSCGGTRVSSDGTMLQVDVRGRTIALPAPDGMADGLSVRGVPAPRVESGDRMVGVFVPSELRSQVVGPGFRPKQTVIATVPGENSSSATANAAEFAKRSEQWASTARRLADTTTRTLAVELEYCRSARPEPIPLPAGPPENGWCLGVSEPLPTARQLLVVLPHDGGAEVMCASLVLVRGRMLRLLWSGPVTTVQDVAAASAGAERWVKAVAEANR